MDVELRLVCGLIDHERFFDAPKDLCRELGTLAQTLVQRKKKKKRKKGRKKGSTRRCKEIQAKLGQLTSFRSLSEVAFYIQFFLSCARLRQMIRGDEY